MYLQTDEGLAGTQRARVNRNADALLLPAGSQHAKADFHPAAQLLRYPFSHFWTAGAISVRFDAGVNPAGRALGALFKKDRRDRH